MIITWKQNWRSTCFVPLRSSGEITFWWHYFFRFESSISHTIIQLLGVSVNSIAVLIVAWMTVSSSSVLFLVCSNRSSRNCLHHRGSKVWQRSLYLSLYNILIPYHQIFSLRWIFTWVVVVDLMIFLQSSLKADQSLKNPSWWYWISFFLDASVQRCMYV